MDGSIDVENQHDDEAATSVVTRHMEEDMATTGVLEEERPEVDELWDNVNEDTSSVEDADPTVAGVHDEAAEVVDLTGQEDGDALPENEGDEVALPPVDATLEEDATKKCIRSGRVCCMDVANQKLSAEEHQLHLRLWSGWIATHQGWKRLHVRHRP